MPKPQSLLLQRTIGPLPAPPASPATPATMADVPLPMLLTGPDPVFLDLTPEFAGRKVVMELFPTRFVDEDQLHQLMDKHGYDDPAAFGRNMGFYESGTPRTMAWKRWRGRVNFSKVGRAAQLIERASRNWRQCRSVDEILTAASGLSEGLTLN